MNLITSDLSEMEQHQAGDNSPAQTFIEFLMTVKIICECETIGPRRSRMLDESRQAELIQELRQRWEQLEDEGKTLGFAKLREVVAMAAEMIMKAAKPQ